MKKTVYVLGAGFSIPAGAPSQEKLVDEIFKLHAKNPLIFQRDSIDRFKSFLDNTLNISSEMLSSIPLEDIFTPLDRCILDNISFRDLDLIQIKEIRGIIDYLISRTLQEILTISDKRYIDKFAKFLVNQSSLRKNGEYSTVDNVSVITTNWDILLDKSIQQQIDSEFSGGAVVDYCCYISSYKKEDDRVKPGLEMLGRGGFNVKLLKLHGSLNWLQCPRCQRLYVDLENKIAVDQYFNHEECRHCEKNFGVCKSHKLTSNVIMPTFLKNLSNAQYKLIWNNAGIELSEAEKIVFIGYSLPQADYEMRQLLSRMVRKDAEISVVSFSKRPKSDKDLIELEKRYKVFFGDRVKTPVYHRGAKRYIEDAFK